MQVQFPLLSPTETENLAASIAPHLVSGDVILLSGPVGSGKSVFARALIRSLCGAGQEVPSPSFTLVQTYDCGPQQICHFDLYRLQPSGSLQELGLEQAFASAIALVEWPEILAEWLPERHMAIKFSPDLHLVDKRQVSLNTRGHWPWFAQASGIWRDR